MKSKALFKNGKGELFLEECTLSPPDDSQLLVKVHASLISTGTETSAIIKARNSPAEGKKEQTGYCIAGIVLEAGKNAAGFAKGDRIIAIEWGRAYHADHVVVNYNVAAKIPDGIPFEEAVFATLAGTSLHAVRRVRPMLGEYMVVIGGGLIGQFCAQFGRAAGCRVIMMDRHDSRLAIASTLGAEWTVNPKKVNPVDAVLSFTEKRGADMGIIAFGGEGTEAFNQLVKMMPTPPDGQKLGRISITGLCDITMSCGNFIGNIDIFGATKCGAGYRDEAYHRGASYTPGYVRWTIRDNLVEILREMSAGIFRVKPLLTHRFPFEKAPEAYEKIMNNKDEVLGTVLVY